MVHKDDYGADADMLLMYSGIPSSEGEEYREEATRLLRSMSFKDALRSLQVTYSKINPRAAGLPR